MKGGYVEMVGLSRWTLSTTLFTYRYRAVQNGLDVFPKLFTFQNAVSPVTVVDIFCSSLLGVYYLV